jgi:hypothetical protein
MFVRGIYNRSFIYLLFLEYILFKDEKSKKATYIYHKKLKKQKSNKKSKKLKKAN